MSALISRVPTVPGWFPDAGAEPPEVLRLVCFPHAGGTPSVFRDWAEQLAVPIVPVLLPGRGRRMREQPYTAMRPLAEDIAVALAEGGHTANYAVFGHSMGALLAYEVVCELRRHGHDEPRHLFVSGSRAPHLYGDRSDHLLADPELRQFVHDLGGLAGLDGDGEAPVAGVYLDRRMPVLRADLSLCDRYRWTPRPPLHVPMTAFSASEDPIATGPQVEAWRQHTTGSMIRHHLPGNHFYLNGPSRPRFLRELRRDLDGLRHPSRPGARTYTPARNPA